MYRKATINKNRTYVSAKMWKTLKPMSTVGESVNWCSRFRKQFGASSKN